MITNEEADPSPSPNIQNTKTDSLIERLVTAQETHQRPIKFNLEMLVNRRLRRKAAADIVRIIPMLETSRADDKKAGLVVTAEELPRAREPQISLVPELEIDHQEHIESPIIDTVVVPLVPEVQIAEYPSETRVSELA